MPAILCSLLLKDSPGAERKVPWHKGSLRLSLRPATALNQTNYWLFSVKRHSAQSFLLRKVEIVSSPSHVCLLKRATRKGPRRCGQRGGGFRNRQEDPSGDLQLHLKGRQPHFSHAPARNARQGKPGARSFLSLAAV